MIERVFEESRGPYREPETVAVADGNGGITERAGGEAVVAGLNGGRQGASSDLAGLGKVVAVATGSSYVVGVFVTNAYLQEYKVADFDLLRPRLVFSGVLVMFFLAAVGGMLHVAVTLLRWRSIPWVSRVLAVLFLVLLALLGPIWQLSFHVPWGAVGYQSASAVMAIFSASVLYAVVRPDMAGHVLQGALKTIFPNGGGTSARLAQRTVVIGLVTVLVTATLQFLFSFARSTLPHVPVQYGGLASRPAVLVAANEDAVHNLAEAGAAMEGRRTKPVALVYEGQTYLLVAVQKGNGIGNVIRIRKDDVSAMIVTTADLDNVIDKPL